MTIDTLDQFKAGSISHTNYYKSATLPANISNSYFTTYWKAGTTPVAGSDGSGATDFTLRNRLTTGAVNWINSAGAPKQKYLYRLVGMATQAVKVVLYDRIADTGSITIVPNGSYTWTGSFTAQRLTDGEDHELWAEVMTGLAAYDHTITFTYLDGNNDSRNGTIYINASAPALRMFSPTMYPTVGMKQVTALSGAGNALATGAFSLIWMRRIATIALPANTTVTLNWADLGFPKVYDDSCLATTVFGTGTTSPTVALFMEFMEG